MNNAFKISILILISVGLFLIYRINETPKFIKMEDLCIMNEKTGVVYCLDKDSSVSVDIKNGKVLFHENKP